MHRVSMGIALCTAAAWWCAPTSAQTANRTLTPVTDQMLQKPPPEDWPMWRRTYGGWGHSPLDRIDRRNVDGLRLVWVRPLAAGIQEAAPLVHDGILFFPNPNDVTDALDAATGDLIWRHTRKVPDDAGQHVPNPSINRNLAIYGNLIFDNGADGYGYALDARTGMRAWQTKIADYQTGAEQASGPIVADGKVISGHGCGPQSGPDDCVITALDPQTGKELWRRQTVPRAGEPGDETWGGIAYAERHDVGAPMVPSFDPALNRLYIGTSVTSPAPKFMLAGNDKHYLYHDSTLALNAGTGKIVWYFQHGVDHWGLGYPFERLLVDTKVAPDSDTVKWISPRPDSRDTRRVITGIPGATGIIYTLDRATGQFLWAEQTVEQNVIASIDVDSGAATASAEKVFTRAGQQRLICPSRAGGKSRFAGTYSPETNVMYFPLENTCSTMTSNANKSGLDGPYGLTTHDRIAPGKRDVGVIEAISAETGKVIWKIEQRAATTSLLSTAGDLLFGGDVAGRFRAYDLRSGKLLWQVNLGAPVTGNPVSFAVDGKQYVAVSTGTSPDTTALAKLTPELHPGAGNNLFVFALR